MAELLGLPYSPWSEKARWALDARRVPYVYRHYAPLVGEPLLRWKVRKWRGPATVPVFTNDDGRVLSESTDIARWADGQGSGPALFPPVHDEKIVRFVELSERALSAGRGLSLDRVRNDDEALAEMVPKSLRRPLGKVGVHIARAGIHRTLRKYGADQSDLATHRRVLEGVLDELRSSLARAPEALSARTLLGTFTFADIAMTQALAFVEPPRFGLRIGPACRRAFTDAPLRERYADLIAWRDAVYDAYRPRT